MVRRFAFVLWIALVIAVSLSPLSIKLKLHTIGRFHDFGHYVVYTLTGIFLWLLAEQWLARISAFAFGVALSLAQEWAENRLYHAGFEWKDVRTDLAGLVTGVAVMALATALMSDNRAERSRQRF